MILSDFLPENLGRALSPPADRNDVGLSKKVVYVTDDVAYVAGIFEESHDSYGLSNHVW